MVPSLQVPLARGPASAICLSPPLRSSLPLALSTLSTLLTRDTAPGGYNASIAAVVQSTKLSAGVIAVGTALVPRIKGCGGPADQVSGRRVIAAGTILLQRIESCRRSIDQVFCCRGIGARAIDAGKSPTIHGASAAACGNRGLELAAETIVLQRIKGCCRSIASL